MAGHMKSPLRPAGRGLDSTDLNFEGAFLHAHCLLFSTKQHPSVKENFVLSTDFFFVNCNKVFWERQLLLHAEKM